MNQVNVTVHFYCEGEEISEEEMQRIVAEALEGEVFTSDGKDYTASVEFDS